MSHSAGRATEPPRWTSSRRRWKAEWLRRGYDFADGEDPSAAVVFHFINPEKPKPFRRRQRSTYVVAVHHAGQAPDDVLRNEYPILVRALANHRDADRAR